MNGPPAPRDSALGVVVRRAGEDWEVLLGRRTRSSRFLPGNLVFPGGVIDESDRPGEPGAEERCASREVEEECGIRIEPEQWADLGDRTTPPIFPVRFRTRFFLTVVDGSVRVPQAPPSPGEIDAVSWEPPEAVIRRWQGGESLVPPPVLALLRGIARARGSTELELERVLRDANAREEASPRIEFVPDIWMVPMRSPTLPPATHTNCWMPGGRRFALIDPGSAEPGEVDRLLSIVRRRIECGSTPSCVLLTHHHPDHVAGAAAVAAAVGVPVCAHSVTFDRMGTIPPGRRERIEDREVLDLEGLSLRALHTPGHAPGHLAFLVPERGALITGDLVGGMSTVLIRPEEGDMSVYLDSLSRMESLGCRTLLPGHGPPLPPGALRKTIEHRLEREARLLSAVSAAPRDLRDLAEQAYQDAPDAPVRLREAQALSHLLDLERRGLVRRVGPSSWVKSPIPGTF